MLGPSLHLFERKAAQHGFNSEYVTRLTSHFTKLQASNVPIMFSLMHFALLSGSSWRDLRFIVSRENANQHYTVFPVRKRSGGNRWICVPKPVIKRAQEWIHRWILSSSGALRHLHPASTAFAPGSSIKTNALAHTAADWMIKIDIQNFFESISERQVYHVFRKFEYPALLSFEMARICTRILPPRKDGSKRTRENQWRWNNPSRPYPIKYFAKGVGHLPQGAPSSPMLANYVAIPIDEQIDLIAKEYGATYTRYADDIIVSLRQSNRRTCEEIFSRLRAVVTQAGFTLNRKKSHIRGPGARKIATGLMVNDEKPRLKSAVKNEIELALYFIRKHGLLEHLKHVHSRHPLAYLNHLLGLIYFAKFVEPKFGDTALETYKAVVSRYEGVLDMLSEITQGHQSMSKYKFF